MTADPSPAALVLADRVVADYTWRPEVPLALAPRPYLHPVRTLAGLPVTELMPASHPHHLGVSVAVAEVGGANFWGGRTFMAGHGPAWLDNHGTQEHVRWLRRTPTHLSHLLRWTAIDGTTLLSERRDISCDPVDSRAWALTFDFALANVTGGDLVVRSPASHGRTGAGYGGFFWRAPRGSGSCRVATGSGEGVETVHGGRSPWLAVGCSEWTLVFVAATTRTRSDPWFVRTRDYLGVGSALAWREPLAARRRRRGGPTGRHRRRRRSAERGGGRRLREIRTAPDPGGATA